MGAITGISCKTSAGIFPTHFDSASTLTGLITWSVDLSTLWREKERLYFAFQTILASLALRPLAYFVWCPPPPFFFPSQNFIFLQSWWEVKFYSIRLKWEQLAQHSCMLSGLGFHTEWTEASSLHKDSSESQRAVKWKVCTHLHVKLFSHWHIPAFAACLKCSWKLYSKLKSMCHLFPPPYYD